MHPARTDSKFWCNFSFPSLSYNTFFPNRARGARGSDVKTWASSTPGQGHLSAQHWLQQHKPSSVSETSSEPQKAAGAQEQGGTSWLLLTGAGEAQEEQEVVSCPSAAPWALPGRQGRVRTSLPTEAPLNELPAGTERTKRHVKIKSCSLESRRNLKGNLALILQNTCCSALPACAGEQCCRYIQGWEEETETKDKSFGIRCPGSSEIQSVGLVLQKSCTSEIRDHCSAADSSQTHWDI